MKNYIFPFLIGIISTCSVLLNSCDDEFFQFDYSNSLQNLDQNNKGNVDSYESILNPFDSIGIKHNILLDIYFDLDSIPQSEISKFLVLKNLISQDSEIQDYSNELEHLIYWQNNPNSVYDSISNHPTLTNFTKSYLESFFNWLLLYSDNEDYNHLAFILAFENEILTEDLSIEEKKLILTITSLTRHSFKRKRRKDKDWNFNVTNFIGAYNGELTSSNHALLYTLYLGLSNN